MSDQQPAVGLTLNPSAPPVGLALGEPIEYWQPNLLLAFTDKVHRAVQGCDQGEKVGYAVSLTVLPGQAPGQMIPVFVVAITMPGVEVGSKSYGTWMSMDLHLAEDQVAEQTRALVEQMRQQRSSALTV